MSFLLRTGGLLSLDRRARWGGGLLLFFARAAMVFWSEGWLRKGRFLGAEGLPLPLSSLLGLGQGSWRNNVWGSLLWSRWR